MPSFQYGGNQTFGIQNNQTPPAQQPQLQPQQNSSSPSMGQSVARQQPPAQQPQLQSQQPPAQSNYYGQSSPSPPNQQPQVNNQSYGMTQTYAPQGARNLQPQYGGGQTYSQNSVYSQPSQGAQRPQVQNYTGNSGMGQPQNGSGQTYGISSAPPPASSGTSQHFQPQYGGGQNVGLTNPPATQNYQPQAQNGSGQTIGPTSGNSPMGWSNWTPNNGTQNGQQWQPTAAPAPVQAAPMAATVARPVSAAPAQSIENQALGGAGASASQTQSFLSALNQAGAGNNNTFMNQAPAAQAAVSPLLGPLAASSQAAPTFSYNQGLGASGATNVFGALNPTVGQNFNPNGVTADGTYGGASEPPGTSPQLPSTLPLTNYFQNGNNPFATGTPSSQPQNGSQQTFGIQTPLTSDERAKTGINPDRKDTKDFLDSLKAYQYEYKNQKHGEGPQWSVMAQDLEKTPVGKSAVINTPEGKKVNYARLEAVHLASTAMLNERITKLESKLKASIGKKGK